MRIVIATNNSNKVREIKEIVDTADHEFFSMKDLNIFSDPEEDGSTFYDNAMIKAKSAFEASTKLGLKDYAFLADDSGLCVDALDGGPGIYSARYANIGRNQCSYSDNNKKLLIALKDVAPEKRTAHFETCAVLIFPDKSSISTYGKLYGKIGEKQIGANGFGYDPIFIPDRLPNSEENTKKLTLAQLSAKDKNSLSHRSCALESLFQKL